MNPDVALGRQLGMLRNLYHAVLYYVLWVTCDVHLRLLLKCAWKRSSETLKGSAVKVFQHTQLPFGTFSMQLLGEDI